MNPAAKRFQKKYGAAADAVSRLEIDQEVREQVAGALTEAFDGQPDFMADTFRLIASDPLCACAGTFAGPCPSGTEIRIGMHLSEADGRSAAWRREKPVVRCISCGAAQFFHDQGQDDHAERLLAGRP